MKAIVIIIFVVLSSLFTFAQDLKLSIIKDSNERDIATDHFFLKEINNMGNKTTFNVYHSVWQKYLYNRFNKTFSLLTI